MAHPQLRHTLTRPPALIAIAACTIAATIAIAGPALGDSKRDWLGETSDGTAVRMSELRGRVVVLAFWASWCIPCRVELPEINRIARLFEGKPLTVVAVNKGEKLRDTRSTLDEILAAKSERMAMTPTSDPDSHAAGSFGVFALPTTLLFDARGVLRAEYSGYDRGFADKLLGQVALLLQDVDEIPAAQPISAAQQLAPHALQGLSHTAGAP